MGNLIMPCRLNEQRSDSSSKALEDESAKFMLKSPHRMMGTNGLYNLISNFSNCVKNWRGLLLEIYKHKELAGNELVIAV